jgi:tetratricopeptide (TPR) repeat protein
MSQDPSAELAARLYDEGVVAFRRGDNDECRRLSEAAIRTASAVWSEREQALGHIGLSRADFRDRAYAAGLRHAHKADELATRCGADDVRIQAMHMRAELTRAQGDYAAAVPMYEQLLAADEAAADNRALAMENYNLGSVLLQVGDLRAARARLECSLELVDADDVQQLSYTLLGFAGLLAREGNAEVAARILGAVKTHFDHVGEMLDPAEELELSSHVDAARLVDLDGYEATYGVGATLSLAEARTLVSEIEQEPV